MKRRPSIIQAMESERLFKKWFVGESWQNWKTVLKAESVLPMSAAEIEFFGSVTGGRAPPKRRPRETWILVVAEVAKIPQHLRSLLIRPRTSISNIYCDQASAHSSWSSPSTATKQKFV
jgi:hypothetical protein